MPDSIRKKISAAKGDLLSDVVLKNSMVVNVFTAEIQKSDVAIVGDTIVGVGLDYHGVDEIDLSGKYLLPGLIDGHLHIESTMLTPPRLAAALLSHGTTTVVADPHEIGNVHGIAGVDFMLKVSDGLGLDFFFMMPSCVPATHLETSGAVISAADMAGLKDHARILGLAEVMNFPGVLAGESQLLEKIDLFSNRIIDGHCPSLTGRDLQAYMTAGIRSDHEAFAPEEALEKLSHGMMVMIREGSTAKSLEALLPLVNEKNAGRFCIVADDLHAEDILERGHLDYILKRAVALGLDPLIAIRLVTWNPATYFGLRDRGAVAPGYRADLVATHDLKNFDVFAVYKNGRVVEKDGPLDSSCRAASVPSLGDSCHMIRPTLEQLSIQCPNGKARIIEIVPGQIITRQIYKKIRTKNTSVISDTASDILKLCVAERHKASGRVGLGLVKGFGLKHGAIASSVAHDAHNVIAVGVTDADLIIAIETIGNMGGGIAVVSDENVLANVPLEIAGLMSTHPIETLVKQLKLVKQAASALGCMMDNPFMVLSFLALPVIPELKLTDYGLVDVARFKIVPICPIPQEEVH